MVPIGFPRNAPAAQVCEMHSSYLKNTLSDGILQARIFFTRRDKRDEEEDQNVKARTLFLISQRDASQTRKRSKTRGRVRPGT